MWQSGDFAADWQQAEPHIIAALHHAGDTHEPADVVEMIMEGRAALWVGDRCAVVRDVIDMILDGMAELFVGEDCAVVTQEIELPIGIQLHFWLAGGDLDELVRIQRDIETAARSRGIRRISIIGRRGWRAKLDGYREAGVILVKEI